MTLLFVYLRTAWKITVPEMKYERGGVSVYVQSSIIIERIKLSTRWNRNRNIIRFFVRHPYTYYSHFSLMGIMVIINSFPTNVATNKMLHTVLQWPQIKCHTQY